jgi:hypothetical protein
MRIRLYFGYTVLLAGVSVILKQLAESWKDPFLNKMAGYLILAVAIYMSFLVILGLIRGIREERRYYAHE